MEQIRIIKEMREHDGQTNNHRRNAQRPRYMVWENVPGALSSNNGEDFQAVLEETARIAEEGVSIPGLEKGQKWSYAGAICGDGWSIAWRVHDAQYWGVPQRRKRICVLADFNGYSAADLLFECFRETDTDGCYEVIGYTGNEPRSEVPVVGEGVSGDSAESFGTGEAVTGSVGESVERSSYTLKIRGGREIDSLGKRAGKGPLVQTELSATLGVSTDQTLFAMQAFGQYKDGGVASALKERDWKDNTDLVCLEGNGSRPTHHGDGYTQSETMYTLNGTEHHSVAYGIDRASFNQGQNAKFDFSIEEEVQPTLTSRGPGGVGVKQ